VIEPYEFRVEMYAKRSNWQVALVTRPDDLIGMPEFGPSCRVVDLYVGTPLAPQSGRSA